jgi:hypothetical protein
MKILHRIHRFQENVTLIWGMRFCFSSLPVEARAEISNIKRGLWKNPKEPFLFLILIRLTLSVDVDNEHSKNENQHLFHLR